MNRFFVLLFGVVLLSSCNNDDGDGTGGIAVPPRLLSEVAPENDAEIQEFLRTHFYNYEEFENPPAGFDFKIEIDTIAGDNADKMSIWDSPNLTSDVIDVSSFEFALSDGEENIPHTYYYLEARKGIREGVDGPRPSVADSVFVRYEGKLLNGNSFDGSQSTGVWFDLARIQAPLQGARGFSEAMVNFRAGGEAIVNNDGSFSIEDYGIGIMIFPSGLGFFNSLANAGIPQYAPLVFEIDLFTINEADHDNDGIPSIQEDLNGNGYMYDDNTDQEDEERQNFQLASNFLDLDDDGDGIPTREEILINGEIVKNEEGIVQFPDSDGDNIPDHLDSDS